MYKVNLIKWKVQKEIIINKFGTKIIKKCKSITQEI